MPRSLNSVLGTLEPGHYAMLRGRGINKVGSRHLFHIRNLLLETLKDYLRTFVAGGVTVCTVTVGRHLENDTLSPSVS